MVDNTNTKAASTFQHWGSHGLQYSLTGKELLIRIPIDAATINGARASSSGKNKLVASSGGMVTIPGAPAGLRLNVSAIVPLDAKV